MRNITPVDAFTTPVTTLENGDPVDESSTDPTSQALTDRTYFLQQRLNLVTDGSGTMTANQASSSAAVLTVAQTGNGNGIEASTAGGSGFAIRATGSGSSAAILVNSTGGSGAGVQVNKSVGAGAAVVGSVTGSATGSAGVFSQGANATQACVLIAGRLTAPVRAALSLSPQSAQPTGASEVGDMYVTTAGVLKICTVAGTPGTWVSVGAQT